MAQSADGKIAEIQMMVSQLRHDVRGIISPAALIAEQLQNHGDPNVQKFGLRISGAIERLISALDATYRFAPRHDGSEQ